MKQKKESKDWYIAATHWLTSGFAIPLVIGIVVGIPLVLILGKDNSNLTIASSIIWIIAIWLGVMYSAKFLSKTYIIRDSQKIAKLSTIYLAVIGGGFRLISMIRNGISLSFIIDLCFFAVGVAIFYIFSRKYIQNTDTSEIPQTNTSPQSN